MNDNEHTIHYSFDNDGYCATQCPHCDFLLRVGSETCHQCTYFVSHDYKRKIVTCNCPENTMNQYFIPNTLLRKYKNNE